MAKIQAYRAKESKTELAVELQGKIAALREELKDEIKNAERNRKTTQQEQEQLVTDLTKMGL
jgi:hypothetical protein